MNKYLLFLLILLIIIGLFTAEEKKDDNYVVTAYVGDGFTEFYVISYNGEDSKPLVGVSRIEKRFAEALGESPSLTLTYLKGVLLSPELSAEDIGSFLSYAHDTLNLACPIAVCDYELMAGVDIEEAPASLVIPGLLEGKERVSIFEYMNGSRIPFIYFVSGLYYAGYNANE